MTTPDRTWRQRSGPGRQVPLVAPRPRELSVPRLAGVSLTVLIAECGMLALLVERVVTRFFTEKVPVLPGVANFADVLLAPLFLMYVLLIVGPEVDPRVRRIAKLLALLLAAFLVTSLASALLNPYAVDALPAGMFLVGHVEPVLVLLAALLLPSTRKSMLLGRSFILLGILQFLAVLLFDLRLFSLESNPDLITGTFGENSYQMNFFLIVWNAIFLYYMLVGSTLSNAWRVSIVGVTQVLLFSILFLSQYRQFLPILLGAHLLILALLPLRRALKAAIALAMAVLVLVCFIVVMIWYPNLKWGEVGSAVTDLDAVLDSGRARALTHLIDAWQEQPGAAVYGLGPGTYSSRAFRTFALFGEDRSDVPVNAFFDMFGRISGGSSLGSINVRSINPNTDLEADYGSYVFASPYTSYVSLLAEVGIVGLALLIALYVCPFRALLRLYPTTRRGGRYWSAAVTLGAIVGIAMLLPMSVLDNWLEVTRLTVPVALLCGVALSERSVAEAPSTPSTAAAAPSTAQGPRRRIGRDPSRPL